MKSSRTGFTLIELLIVVAIIAILAAIAVPNFLEAHMRSRIASTIHDMKTVATGIEMYLVDNNQFPMFPHTQGGGTYVLPDRSYMNDTLRVDGDRAQHMGNLLSTPVSYLTAVPFDWFNSHQVKASGAYWGGRRISFIFWGLPIGGPGYWVRGGDAGPRTFITPPTGVPTRYFMESCGPDRKWHSSPGYESAYLYNPTNGTLSKGQLVFWDGAGTNPAY